jgi:c-di-GMP-binding flagellar brake protein YcgR
MFFKKRVNTDFEERRNADRNDFIQATYYKLIDSEDKSLKECYICDISKGGISFFTTSKDIEEGAKLCLIYNLKSTRRKDEAVVRYIKNSFGELKCGCEFSDTDEEREKLIKTITS